MYNETTNLDVNLLLQESKETLLNPKAYFTTMPTSGGLMYPVIKVLIYGTIAGVLAFLWSIFNLSVSGGVFGGGGLMIIIRSAVGSVVGLFIGAIILLIISSICKGSQDFETIVRIVAALMVLAPVRAALGFFDSINFTLGAVIGTLISVYGVYMLYHAMVISLKADEKPSRIVSYIFAGILLLVFLSGFSGRRQYLKNYYQNRDDAFQKPQTEMVLKG